MKETEDTSLPKKRRKTDRSLTTERAKADATLLEDRRHIERHADKSVSEKRDEADQVVAHARFKADANGTSVDASLHKERVAADTALKDERLHADAVLEEERLQGSQAEAETFANERKETDNDLTSERSQTDVHVERVAETLLKEKTAHELTQAALMTRDEILAIVSHDLRNPVGAISSASMLLEQNPHYKNADQDSRMFIDIIQRSASTALRLIADLMDAERITSNKFSIEIAEHDICETISHSVKSFASQAASKQITLTADFSTQSAFVYCDRDRISQVLANLIGNALKFTPKGDVTLTVRRHGVDTLISVADTGSGIPPDQRAKVFERFSQIENRDRTGLGLGLYISKVIVESHKGKIWVEANTPQGSKFSFTLPSV